GSNTAHPDRLEQAGARGREVLERIPDPAVRESYRERAAGWIGVQPHLLSSLSPAGRGSGRGAETGSDRQREIGNNGKPGLAARAPGKKVTVARYLVQLLALWPLAFAPVTRR